MTNGSGSDLTTSEEVANELYKMIESIFTLSNSAPDVVQRQLAKAHESLTDAWMTLTQGGGGKVSMSNEDITRIKKSVWNEDEIAQISEAWRNVVLRPMTREDAAIIVKAFADFRKRRLIDEDKTE